MSGFYRWRSARCEIATAGDWMTGSHANHAVFPQGQCDTVTALLAAGCNPGNQVVSHGAGSHKGTLK